MLHETRLRPKQKKVPKKDKSGREYLTELLDEYDFAKWQAVRWQGYYIIEYRWNHILYYGRGLKTMRKDTFDRLVNSGLIVMSKGD